jgi:hypothetical protein
MGLTRLSSDAGARLRLTGAGFDLADLARAFFGLGFADERFRGFFFTMLPSYLLSSLECRRKRKRRSRRT